MVRLVRHWPEACPPYGTDDGAVQHKMRAMHKIVRSVKEYPRYQELILRNGNAFGFPYCRPWIFLRCRRLPDPGFPVPLDEVARSTIREYMLQTCPGEFRLGSRSQATERKPSCPLPSTPRTPSPPRG